MEQRAGTKELIEGLRVDDPRPHASHERPHAVRFPPVDEREEDAPEAHADVQTLRCRAALDPRMVERTCHELRGHLAVISGFAELLAEGHSGTLNGDQAEHLAILRRSVGRLNRSIEDLTTVFSTLVTAPASRETDLAGLVDGLLLENQPRFAGSGVKLSAHVEGSLLPLRLDGRRLREALRRLLDHALRFAPRDSRTLVRVRSANDRIRIEVRDSGPGLSLEEVGHAFDYLHRAAGFRSFDDPGGHDLTVCRAMVESLGGNVHAANRRGEGTIYVIELPVARESGAARETEGELEEAPQPPRPGPDPRTRSRQDERPERDGAPGQRPRSTHEILVVENDPEIRKALRIRLSAAGYTIHQAEDGLEGLLSCMQHHPDLLLLESSLPSGDGFSIVERVRMHPELARTPFIMVTASCNPELRTKALALGASAFLQKPFEAEDLLREIAKAVSPPALST